MPWFILATQSPNTTIVLAEEHRDDIAGAIHSDGRRFEISLVLAGPEIRRIGSRTRRHYEICMD